jgi:hypothetical protein
MLTVVESGVGQVSCVVGDKAVAALGTEVKGELGLV